MSDVNWTLIAKRYSMAENAVPERPWWRFVGHVQRGRYSSPDFGVRFVRTDGRGATTTTEEPDVLADLDRRYPMPAPPPACGQVWVRDDEKLVTRISGDEVWFGEGCCANVSAWPPVGVLVAGPGAPWMDTSGGSR